MNSAHTYDSSQVQHSKSQGSTRQASQNTQHFGASSPLLHPTLVMRRHSGHRKTPFGHHYRCATPRTGSEHNCPTGHKHKETRAQHPAFAYHCPAFYLPLGFVCCLFRTSCCRPACHVTLPPHQPNTKQCMCTKAGWTSTASLCPLPCTVPQPKSIACSAQKAGQRLPVCRPSTGSVPPTRTWDMQGNSRPHLTQCQAASCFVAMRAQWLWCLCCACSRSTCTTDLNANHSGMSSPAAREHNVTIQYGTWVLVV